MDKQLQVVHVPTIDQKADIEAATIQEEPLSYEAFTSFPKQGESHTVLFEANIMANKPRRVTLEDYSSSSMSQFFTSIARPEVQAQNITLPHHFHYHFPFFFHTKNLM